jgi:twinkle protein
MSFQDLNIIVKSHPEQQKVKCPECVRQGKQHINDVPLSVNIKTGAYNCHKCGWNGYAFNTQKMDEKIYQKPNKKNFTKLSDTNLQYCSKRGISQQTVIRNKLVNSIINNWIVFPYFVNGEIVNFKARNSVSKDFRQQTEGIQVLYKYDDIKESKEIIVCEGEFDALSFEEAGYLFATSVSQGAPNVKDKNIDKKLECLTNSYDAFEQAETVYIAVDNDPNGNRLKEELIRRIGFEKCKLVDFNDCKDANEYLLRYGKESLRMVVESAKVIKMDGVFTTEDVFDKMIFSFRTGKIRGTTTYFKSLDEHWTWRKKEVNVFTGYGNDGKSAFYNQLAVLKAYHENWKFAVFTPENLPIEDYFDDLIHCFVGKSTDKSFRNAMNEMEYVEASNFIKNSFFVISPENDFTIESIFERTQYLVRKHGIDALLIDPYNQIEHLMNPGEREDLYISRFMRKLANLAVTNDISVTLIAHQLTPQMFKGDTDYPKPDMYRIKGGGNFSDKADNVLTTWRPHRKTLPNDRTVKICVERVRKQRLVGIPGEIELYYSRAKNQYYESLNEAEDLECFNLTKKQVIQQKLNIETDEAFWGVNSRIEMDKEEIPF